MPFSKSMEISSKSWDSLNTSGIRIMLPWSMTSYKANAPSIRGVFCSPSLCGHSMRWLSDIFTSLSWTSSSLILINTPSNDTFLEETGELAGCLRSRAHWTKVDLPTPEAPSTATLTSGISPTSSTYFGGSHAVSTDPRYRFVATPSPALVCGTHQKQEQLTGQRPFEACPVSSSSAGPGDNKGSFSLRLSSSILEPC